MLVSLAGKFISSWGRDSHVGGLPVRAIDFATVSSPIRLDLRSISRAFRSRGVPPTHVPHSAAAHTIVPVDRSGVRGGHVTAAIYCGRNFYRVSRQDARAPHPPHDAEG